MSNVEEDPIEELIKSAGFVLSKTEKKFIHHAVEIPGIWPHVGAYVLSVKLTDKAIRATNNVVRATWVLAGATIALALATIALVVFQK